MPENKPTRFLSSQGWIEENAATGTPPPRATAGPARPAAPAGPRIGLGVGLAAGGWALAALPIMVVGAYIRLVNDCLSSSSSSCPGSTEGGNLTVALLVIVCMVLGPAFLGFAAATQKRWAWLATGVLALPVVFVGYELIANTFL